MNSLFDDVPAIPDCTDFLNYEPIKRKYGTPDKIASEMLDEAKRWQRQHPDKNVLDIVTPTWREYIKFNLQL